MIGGVRLLRNQLNACMRLAVPQVGDDVAEDRVQLIDGDQTDPVQFRLHAVTVLLISIEQETCLRSVDSYLRGSQPAGCLRKLIRHIRLNLYVLFAARFKALEQELNHLAMVIRFAQQHHALDHITRPALSRQIDKLVLEPVALPLA